jgi:hypothetical protein
MTTKGIEAWEQAVKEANRALLELERAFAELAEDKDVATVCNAVVEAHLIKQSMSVAYDSICHIVDGVMGTLPEFITTDGTKVEKRVGNDRKKWKHEELAQNIASRLSDMSVDMSTGEITMTPQEMVVKLLDYCAPSYWRVKELAKIGISADKFCEVEEREASIIVRKAK